MPLSGWASVPATTWKKCSPIPSRCRTGKPSSRAARWSGTTCSRDIARRWTGQARILGRELAIAYPQSKVILSVRPEAAWWTSFSATIGALFDAPDQVPLPPHLRTMRDVAIEMIQVQTFGCPSTDREGVLAAYRRRTEEVCAAIPAERLLVFNVAEGWAPLCRFLDVPVPDAPFPRMNSTEQFWKMVRGEQH
jgi:hypothetical protein